MARYALQATARFYGQTVDETFARSGARLQIGNTPLLAVPVPDGAPYLARAWWTGHDTVVVEQASGEKTTLKPGGCAELTVGPVTLQMRLVPHQWLTRFELPSWRMSLGWLLVVVGVTVLARGLDTANAVYDTYACPILFRVGHLMQERYLAQQLQIHECVDANAAAGAGATDVYTAEYLARLLKEDYAGEDDGSLDLPEAENAEKKEQSFYLPAGAEGPTDEMGGAENTSAEPIRHVPETEEPAAAPVEDEPAEPAVDENGAPVQDDEGIADAADEAKDAAEEGAEELAEEKRGWGVKDWYDAADQRVEEQEIDVMLRVAKQRLRIDPDDPEALSILSYYQYLAQDYESALRTYDRFIELYPESSAGYNNKALVYKRQSRYTEEEALYRVALSLEPDDVTALNNLAVNLSHQKRFDEALAIMNRLERLDPGDPYAELHRSKIFAEMGEEERAYEHLELALEGMKELDTLHHIEFRQDIRLDPSFSKLRDSERFHAILVRYYGKDSPLDE